MIPPSETPFQVPLRLSSSTRRPPGRPHGDSAPRKTPQTGFLFIDAQVDNPQNHELQREKQAFVLNKYFRKRREAAIERVRPSKPLPSTSRRRPEPQLQRQYQAAGDEENQRHEHYQQQTSNDCNAIAQYAATASQMTSLTTFLGQGYTDPFSSVTLEMTNPRYSYFYHFRVHTIPACYPLDTTRISTYWWRHAITQPALLQALLFLAAGHQASLQLSNKSSSQEVALKALRDSLHSRGDSLRLLQNIIQDPAWAVAESTGLTIATLVTIEAVNANFTAVEAHMKGLKRLIQVFGGLERANHMFLSKIYLSDIKAAALTNTRPIFPIIPKWRNGILQHAKLFRFDPNTHTSGGRPESEFELSLIAASRERSMTLGGSVFTAPWFAGLSASMRTFLHVFARLMLYYEEAVRNPALVMDTDNDLYILFEHQLLATRYRYPATMYMQPGLSGALDDDTNEMALRVNSSSPLDEPLRLTLLIYLTTRMWHLQPFPAMAYITASLRDTLAITLLDPDPGTNTTSVIYHLNTVAPDLLFWVLFVGGTASQGYTPRSWFADNLALPVRSLGLKDWGEARKVLGDFFWSDQDCFQKDEQVLWKDALDKAGDVPEEERSA
ncbi:hypothetical protein BJX63DRAFT_443402 [Aspergillus granulosus]|uniref:Uncharacterized protein n=1 Tax=Aspergillus granulosus TaxID=176169 RepID=A0ABR4HAW4_9EURO